MLIKLIAAIIKYFANKSSAPLIVTANANDVLTHEAQDWIGIVDTYDHTSVQIDEFRRAVNKNPNKENWCADFVCFCVAQVEKKLGIQSELFRSELAQDLYYKSPLSMRLKLPEPGAVVVWRHGNTILGHTGIIESINTDGNLITIEGNTNQAVGIVRNGGGVYRRIRSTLGTPQMSVIGFLKVF